jgi:hypothetical protein
VRAEARELFIRAARRSTSRVDDLRALFASPLILLALPNTVTGGAAAIVSGDPRLTNDLDVVLAMRPSDAATVATVFAALVA